MKKKELIAEISDLPINKRAEIADEILKTLNRPDPAIEKVWGKEAQRRLKELENGEVESIPGEEVMKELKSITGE